MECCEWSQGEKESTESPGLAIHLHLKDWVVEKEESPYSLSIPIPNKVLPPFMKVLLTIHRSSKGAP